jgi:hypothetical protein
MVAIPKGQTSSEGNNMALTPYVHSKEGMGKYFRIAPPNAFRVAVVVASLFILSHIPAANTAPMSFQICSLSCTMGDHSLPRTAVITDCIELCRSIFDTSDL